MNEHLSRDQTLIRKLTEIILANLENENFGVKELALESGMNQYRLSRRLRSISNKSITQFISETRLRKALEMLQNEELTVAEVSYRAGFHSPAYFTKCFHEFFGYPPSKVQNAEISFLNDINTVKSKPERSQKKSPRRTILYLVSGILILSGIIYFINNVYHKKSSFIGAGSSGGNREMSIAVLPFRNLSNNPDDMYIYDGVMDEILTNLSRIHDLRVVSRTTVEQFRESTKSASQIAKKLDVDYIVEGSGQKYGNTFKLRIQLIEASRDKHIWARSYEKEIRETKDIFNIQSQAAQSIATEVNASITQEEKLLIDKISTTSLTAYDFFLRGRNELYKYKASLIYRSDLINMEQLARAEEMFNKALDYDSVFGRAYIGLADIYWARHWSETYLSENFLDSVLILADQALSYDDRLAEGYYYRGEYYSQKGETEKALIEYNLALKYNPNYWEVYYTVGQNVFLYNYDHMDFVKGLEYLHKAVSINHGTELPFLLRELGDAFSGWAGFPEISKYYYLEALKLDNDTNSLYTFKTDKEKLEALTKKYSGDSSNLWTILNLTRTYAELGQYKEALKYTKKYQNRLNERSYLFFSGRTGIGYIYWMNGYKKEAEKWFSEQIRISEESLKLGRNYSMDAYCDLASIYALTNQKEKALENLRIFAKNRLFPYFRVIWMKEGPMLNSIRNEPEFQKILKDIESKYQAEHERVEKWLEEQGML
jgi:TolB-like protein/AraC-like DNA-binding protein/Tfp pilus assembly protein PilF